MILVAVAGGTSPTLGHAIVTAINDETANSAIILSSRATDGRKYGADVRTTDYSSIPSLTHALNGVHTVILVVKIVGPHAVQHETNHLRAAQAAGVKRFARAAFENGPLATERVTILALTKPAGLVDAPIIWDVGTGRVEMPVKEDGTAPRLTMTSLRDVGRFVAAASELPEGSWQGSMQMVGETVALDEVMRIVEEVTGRRMRVSKVGRGELESAGIEGIGSTRAEVFDKMVSEINLLALGEKEGMCVLKPVVNEMCSWIQPMSVREMVQLA